MHLKVSKRDAALEAPFIRVNAGSPRIQPLLVTWIKQLLEVTAASVTVLHIL
jgi:hypothetical protein